MILNLILIAVGVGLLVAGKNMELGPLKYIGVLFLIIGAYGLVRVFF